MQVFKKFSLCFVCLSLVACSSTKNQTITGSDTETTFSEAVEGINISANNSFRVAVLLPLTGVAAKQGQGLKKATMLALEDVKNPNLILQYYDTKSSESGARIAAENAISQQSNLIVGPLMSSEVQAISNETIYKGVPVIAFSTSQEILQPTIYTLGLLVEEQVNRIITYAAENKNKKHFALLLPDNSNGIAVAKAALKSAQINNVNITVVGFYPPSTSNFSNIIKDMTDYERRSGNLNKLKNSLQTQANRGNVPARNALERLASKESIGAIKFDAVIIPESGAKLVSAISMFSYYDAAYPQVQFLGTSVWENSNLNNESMVAKSLYPSLSRPHSAYFANKYSSTFAESPSVLYSFAYDAIALANELSKQDTDDLNSAITSPEGYAGINGSFRLFEDGSNQHSLNIMEVRPTGDVAVDVVSHKFSDDDKNQQLQDIEIDENFKAPLIYGKDNTTAQILLFGDVLPIENQPSTYIDIDEERKAINKELKRLNIVIP